MQGRVGVGRASGGLQLALNSGGLGGAVAHQGEAPDTLTVEAHVLGVGLAEPKLVPVLSLSFRMPFKMPILANSTQINWSSTTKREGERYTDTDMASL